MTDQTTTTHPMPPSAYLTDDGTLDTVIACGRCGGETRFNIGDQCADIGTDPEQEYGLFVADCIADVNAECMHCDADE